MRADLSVICHLPTPAPSCLPLPSINRCIFGELLQEEVYANISACWSWHRYEKVGSEGYHSLFRWYSAFEAAQFPDPSGLRARLSAWTLGEPQPQDLCMVSVVET